MHESRRAFFEALLKLPGYVGDIARMLVSLARAQGKYVACEYEGIELWATPTTTPEEIERAYSRRMLKQHPEWKGGVHPHLISS